MKYDTEAKRISKGKTDEYKQRQLYVDIDKNGFVIPYPIATQKEIEKEMDKAERLCFLL